jgi:proteasome lid subunit RPN8/RPN11
MTQQEEAKITPKITSSGSFIRRGDEIQPLIQYFGGRYFCPMQHPVFLGYTEMTDQDRHMTNEEFLTFQDLNFWNLQPSPVDPSKVITSTGTFQKVPKEDWIKTIKLFAHFCRNDGFPNELEVGLILALHNESQTLRLLVPKQSVTKASVNWTISDIKSDTQVMDLDGNLIVMSDYTPVGVFHSHNTFGAFPSSVDNTCEVKDTAGKIIPTGFHMILGNFKNYENYEFDEPTFDTYSSFSHLGVRHQVTSEKTFEFFVSDDFSVEEYQQNTFSTNILTIITRSTVWSGKVYTGKSYATRPYSGSANYVNYRPFRNPEHEQAYNRISKKHRKASAANQAWRTSTVPALIRTDAKEALIEYAISCMYDIYATLVDDLSADPVDLMKEFEAWHQESLGSNNSLEMLSSEMYTPLPSEMYTPLASDDPLSNEDYWTSSIDGGGLVDNSADVDNPFYYRGN